jgi:cobalt transport protein ATP-binding subunit
VTARAGALTVRDLHCRFDDPPAQALAGVSIEARRGELVAVMGASGAGKSTLLRCINALVPALLPAHCEGSITLDDEPVLGRSVGELGGRVAMVFQDFEAQLFSTNVRLEIAFGPGQLGVEPGEIRRRVDRMLAMLGLGELVARDPSTLSGGQKQRLAIASILAMQPDVMLLDEPATDLDPIGRIELYTALQRLRQEAVALVAVEHEIEPVLGADRIYLMRDGIVAASGPPAELVRDTALFAACGVRPYDLAVLAERLRIELPLDVDQAIEALRRWTAGRPRTATSTSAAAPSTHAQPPILEVDHLSFTYDGGKPALDDVSVAIGAGEMIALIGQNGSGKTTLAKHLNGLLRAQSGTVRLDRADIRTLPLERVAPQVGYVFQNPDHQLFAPTVEEEVAFGPRNFGMPASEITARVASALDAVGLATLRDRDPFLLSKGERQRLAVATVLAMQPRILILDEPTTGLDYPQQRRMLDLLARVRAAGATVIIITHTPWVVAEYAERALLMRAGRLVFDGPLGELLADAALLRSASFEAPPATRVAQALGIPARSVADLARALGAED